MDVHLLLLFLGVDLLLACTPGPDWLYVSARALGQGRRAGLVATAGICAGYTVHTALVAAGLAAAVAAVPALLPVLRYAGAAYLVYLAAGMLLALRRGGGPGLEAARPQRPGTILRQSMLTALLNPKGLLLFLALIPQFTSTGAALPVGVQLAVLGLLHVAVCGALYSVLAAVMGLAGRALSRTPRARRWTSAVSAAMLLAVAAVTVR